MQTASGKKFRFFAKTKIRTFSVTLLLLFSSVEMRAAEAPALTQFPYREKVVELLKIILETQDESILNGAFEDFKRAALTTISNRSESLKEQDLLSDPNWPKDSIQYTFYVDQFGVSKKTGTFEDSRKMLPYLKALGVNLLYPLPFLQSEGMDGGFDVSSYFVVEPRLGGNQAFDRFLSDVKANKMKFQMDLILNHVSDQHPWFQAFIQGDKKYKNYFIVRDSKPEVLREYESEGGKVVVYKENTLSNKGEEVHRRLILPNVSTSHFREVQLKSGRHNWVYHTFYPFQVDLNYSNPEVLKEVYQIVGSWSNKGVDIFRLDAIPFLDKRQENHLRTHSIIQLLNTFLKITAPSIRIKVEACQKLSAMGQYFGKQENALSNEAHIAYQFEGMANTWLSLISHNKSHYEEYLRILAQQNLPESAVWAVFVRLHDELSLEMVPDSKKEILRSLALRKMGLGFRNGSGVAGRLSNFLENNFRRITLAFSLLLSQEGIPIIYYGDEVAAQNNGEYLVQEGAKREAYFKSQKMPFLEALDARDFGRGPLPASLFDLALNPRDSSLNSRVFENVRRMIGIRKDQRIIRRGRTRLIPNDQPDVISYLRFDSTHDSPILIVHNLSDSAKKVSVKVDSSEICENLKISLDLLTNQPPLWTKKGSDWRLSLNSYQSQWLQLQCNDRE